MSIDFQLFTWELKYYGLHTLWNQDENKQKQNILSNLSTILAKNNKVEKQPIINELLLDVIWTFYTR